MDERMGAGVGLTDGAYGFCSYAHGDVDLVDEIYHGLSARLGYPMWRDSEKLRYRDCFDEKIAEGIEGCTVFLMFLTERYLRSDFCKKELRHANAKNRNVIAVYLEPIGEDGLRQWGNEFTWENEWHRINYNIRWERDRAVSDICDKIARELPFDTAGEPRDIYQGDWASAANQYRQLVSHLEGYHQEKYRQDGNYQLDQIKKELFPGIHTDGITMTYSEQSAGSRRALVEALHRSQGKRILLMGEGGMGKTVSLLECGDRILQEGQCAVYICLRAEWNENTDIRKYLEINVCGNNPQLWRPMERCMHSREGNGLVLLLDGLNELPTKDANELVRQKIERDLMSNYPGVQVVISSRNDFRKNLNLEDAYERLNLCALSQKNVEDYLANCNVEMPRDAKVRELLTTPLLITLYANASAAYQIYNNAQDRIFEKNPDTAGKILSNFFITQLYRAEREINFVRANHLVLIHYLLPLLAYDMVRRGKYTMSKAELLRAARQCKESVPRFQWYMEDILDEILDGEYFDEGKSVELEGLARKSLHFLHSVGDGGGAGEVEFSHQNFRDYFAAYHLANEIRALNQDRRRMDEVDELCMEMGRMDEEILRYLSDILGEEQSCPVQPKRGERWSFPGKEQGGSPLEQGLSLWRGREGIGPQNAVYNTLTTLAFARKNQLASCDFSRLDLRSCQMNGCHFVEWDEQGRYPANFDGAWLDRTFFVHSGHEAEITAVCGSDPARMFSGDNNGVVRVYHLEERRWEKTLAPSPGRVLDLAVDSEGHQLAILYKNVVFHYDYLHWKQIDVYPISFRNRKYHYVRFSESGEVEVAYDNAPLLWYQMDGTPLPTTLPGDIYARCAKMSPRGDMLVRSRLVKSFMIRQWNEDSDSWTDHPKLVRDKEAQDKEAQEDEQLSDETKQGKGKKGKRLNKKDVFSSICVHASSKKFLVSFKQNLIEYDTETLEARQSLCLKEGVRCACYRENGDIIVGTVGRLLLLNGEFEQQMQLLNTQLVDAKRVLYAPPEMGDGFIFLAKNREMKRLDRELRVLDIRQVCSKEDVALGKKIDTDEICFVFEDENCFYYEKNYHTKLPWDCRILEHEGRSEERGRVYTTNRGVFLMNQDEKNERIDYVNYGGVWIFGCSFVGVQGIDKKFEDFLRKNGGVLDE